MSGALAAAALVFAVAGTQDAPAPVWRGVWAGTVGGLPVRACLDQRGPDYAVGSYYYLRHLRPIELRPVGRSRTWVEGLEVSGGPERPRWTFDRIGASTLAGTWSGNGRRSPFALTRAAVLPADAEPCGSALFNGPRLRPLRRTAERASKDGVGYTELRFDVGPAFDTVELQSFALDGDTPAVRRVNAALSKLMSGEPARSGWFECLAGSLASHGRDGDYSAVLEPTMISTRWLAADESVGGYCGGAHPSSGVTSLAFDLSSGAEVALYGWLNDRAVERHGADKPDERYWTMRPALRRVVIGRWTGGEAECREAAGAAEFWDVGLTRRGLRFTPSLAHVLTACEEPVVVPWDVLAPFLSAAGRAGAGSVGR